MSLLFLVLGASVLADEGSDDIERLPEGHSVIDVPGAEIVQKGIYTIPRKQVLLEIATGVW